MAGPHGRVSSMGHTASCRERPTSTCLTDVYRCFQAGSCPSHSAAEAADEIFSMILPGEDGRCAPAGYCHGNRSELTYISLTLVEKIISSLTSRSLPPPVALYCADIERVLFQDMDLMSQLVSARLSSCSVKKTPVKFLWHWRSPLLHRSVSSMPRTRSSHIWLPRVYQRGFSIISSNLWVFSSGLPHFRNIADFLAKCASQLF